MSNPKPPAGLFANATAAFTSLTSPDDVTAPTDPKDPTAASHPHLPADHPASHSWLSSFLPSAATLTSLESYFRLGNYVRTSRATNALEWEPMALYVRLGMHLLYYGTYQEQLLETATAKRLLEQQSQSLGRAYDAPASRAHIAPFIKTFALEPTLADLAEPDPQKYPNFNAFFARALRDDARAQADPANPLLVSSPADCRLTVFPSIDQATTFWIKGFNFTLARLFQDQGLADRFDGGSMLIARLAPQDYHRWHAPVCGRVVSTKEIQGAYYTVNPQAVTQEGQVNVFCENRRSVMVLDDSHVGAQVMPVAIVAVGAMLVGSIKYVGGRDKPDTRLKRGDCLGVFYYGGSTVLVVFPKGAAKFDDDLVRWSCGAEGGQPVETLVRVGERVGVREGGAFGE